MRIPSSEACLTAFFATMFGLVVLSGIVNWLHPTPDMTRAFQDLLGGAPCR